MSQMRVAKLFRNGASQAVRLPVDFRFNGTEVYITQDNVTGDVVLSSHPGSKIWKDFFEFMHTVGVPKDFMAKRPMNVLPKERNLFDEKL